MVLMLGAISLGRTAYGLVLVVAFSLGLAIVLSSIGLLFLYARRFMDRLPLGGRIANAIPVVSAVVIVGLGLMLTVRAVPALM
jgi:nickel/cobalt exporter